MRLLTTVRRVTCAACPNAASVLSLSPISQSNATLRCACGQTCAAPSSIARAEVGDGGQDVVFDRDRLGGVAGELGALGDDEGDRIADMADHAVGQHRMRRERHRRAVAVLHRGRARQAADAVGVEVRAGIDRQHARHRPRRRGVDRGDAGGGMRAAQHHALHGAGQGDVIGVGAAALQQARVLDAADGLGKAELRHGANSLPVSCDGSGTSLGRGGERPRGSGCIAGRARGQP